MICNAFSAACHTVATKHLHVVLLQLVSLQEAMAIDQAHTGDVDTARVTIDLPLQSLACNAFAVVLFYRCASMAVSLVPPSHACFLYRLRTEDSFASFNLKFLWIVYREIRQLWSTRNLGIFFAKVMNCVFDLGDAAGCEHSWWWCIVELANQPLQHISSTKVD